MTDTAHKRHPDLQTAVNSFFRNTLRAVTASNSRNFLWAMMEDLTDIQNHLDDHKPRLQLAPVLIQAMKAITVHEKQSELVEAQLELGFSAVRHVAELSEAGHKRPRRLATSSKRLREAMQRLDQVKSPDC